MMALHTGSLLLLLAKNRKIQWYNHMQVNSTGKKPSKSSVCSSCQETCTVIASDCVTHSSTEETHQYSSI